MQLSNLLNYKWDYWTIHVRKPRYRQLQHISVYILMHSDLVEAFLCWEHRYRWKWAIAKTFPPGISMMKLNLFRCKVFHLQPHIIFIIHKLFAAVSFAQGDVQITLAI